MSQQPYPTPPSASELATAEEEILARWESLPSDSTEQVPQRLAPRVLSSGTSSYSGGDLDAILDASLRSRSRSCRVLLAALYFVLHCVASK